MSDVNLSQQHTEDEVYNFMGKTPLADLHEKRGFDIGSKTLEVFRRSDFYTVEDVRTVGDDDFSARITAAITGMCPANEQPMDLKWKQMAARCKRVRRKLKNASAHPFEPEHLCCPISWCLFEDPVITPHGISFSRQFIQDHLRLNGDLCPMTRKPLTIDQLIPNYALRDAVEYYENNYLRFSLYRQDALGAPEASPRSHVGSNRVWL